MAPVAAAISGNSSGATKSKTQSIAWPGPAMKPSSDIDLFTTTLPFPVLVSLTLFLRCRTLPKQRGGPPDRRLVTLDATQMQRVHLLWRDSEVADVGVIGSPATRC